MGKVSDIQQVLYEASLWTAYWEQDWAGGNGRGSQKPTAVTGSTSVIVEMPGPVSTWSTKRVGLAAKLRALNRRAWISLSGSSYSGTREVVLELERTVGDLVEGYVMKDEPALADLAMLKDQMLAIRECSSKPAWLNMTAGRMLPEFFQMGGADIRLYPEIYTTDLYPNSFAETSSGAHPFINRWYTSQKEPGLTAWDTAAEIGANHYPAYLLWLYMTQPNKYGVRLSPANGHVCGIIGQGHEQYSFWRQDKGEASFITWRTWTNADAVEMQKLMLGKSPFHVAVNGGGHIPSDYTLANYAPPTTVDSIQVLQFRSLYRWFQSTESVIETDATWEARILATRTVVPNTGSTPQIAERSISSLSTSGPATFRLAAAALAAKTAADGYADITGDVIYPAGAAEPATSGQCFPPRIEPFGVFYDETERDVTLSCDTSGATIRYTTDGSVPTSGVGTVYSAPFTVNANTTIRAIAYKGGVSDSPVNTRRLMFVSTTPPVNLTSVKLYAVSGKTATLNGAKVQGSNDLSSWTDLYTIGAEPSAGYVTYTFTPGARYRYFRLTHASQKVAAANLQWKYQTEILAGTAIASACTAGREVAYAYDGSTSTYAEVAANGGYIGWDTGAVALQTRPYLDPAVVEVAEKATVLVKINNMASRTVTSRTVSPGTYAAITAYTAGTFTVGGIKAGLDHVEIVLSDGTQLDLDVRVTGGEPLPTPTVAPASHTLATGATVRSTVASLATRTISTAVSGNAGIATVAFYGANVDITGVSAGSTTITITISDGTVLTVAVTVQASPPAAVPSLSPTALSLTRGESGVVALLNLGVLTWTHAIANASICSAVAGTSSLTVTGLAGGGTTILITLSNASTLTLTVFVSAPPPPPLPSSTGKWLSVPRG